MALAVTLLCFLVVCSAFSVGDALSYNYYEETCPGAEAAIENAIMKAVAKDKTVPAALLRMHFHDSFLKGCDASVLLDSTANNTAEKAGSPNLSLHAFFAIDNAKQAVEAICPGVVSCADVLALSARDVVALSGGPSWDVPKGRKDGRISLASETTQLPSPTFNLSQLQQSFSKRGLGLEDLVALSGGHTLGFAHCSSFRNRIHNFDSTHDIDPSLQASFAASLRSKCPIGNTAKNAGANMDTSPTTFDNTYFKLILQGKSLFSSDQALLTSPATNILVSKFAGSQGAFYDTFVKAMIKMSSITGGQEVRTNADENSIGDNSESSGDTEMPVVMIYECCVFTKALLV